MRNPRRSASNLLILTFFGLFGIVFVADADHEALLGQPIDLSVYTVFNLDGEEVYLPSFTDGKAYLIAFWHIGCLFCQSEGLLALQDEVYDVYDRNQLEVIGINTDIDADVDLIIRYREERNLEYPFYIGGEAVVSELGINVPKLLVVSQAGILVWMESKKTITEAVLDTLDTLGIQKVSQAERLG